MAAIAGWRSDHLALAQSVAVDLAAFENSLHVLINNDDLRERMGQASRARALQRFHWPVVIAQYETLWKELFLLAQASAAEPPTGLELNPSYCDAFSGYPTKMLTDSQWVCLTPAGREVTEGKEPLPAYYTESGVLSRALLEAIFEVLESRHCTIASVVEELRTKHPTGDQVRRATMWLIKYGFASLMTASTE